MRQTRFLAGGLPGQGYEMLFDAHTRSFQAARVTRRGIYDNMKTAVDKVKRLADSPITPTEARKKTGRVKALPRWPRLLRAVSAWLTPAYWLARCWGAFASAPQPVELAALLGALNAGQGINLYLRI